jgi:acyl-CoA synthetase (NDP forming)
MQGVSTDMTAVLDGDRCSRTVAKAAARAARVLAPAAIAVIGASPRETTLNGRIVRNLLAGGFAGDVYPVNPRYEELLGLRCHPSIQAIGRPVDLALILIGADRVIDAIDACIGADVGAALVFAAGFAEAGAEGVRLQAELGERLGRIVIGGPNFNCVLSQPSSASMGFGPTLEFDVPDAPRAIIAQSGAVGTAVVTRAAQGGIGFRYVIATGNEVDLGIEDYLAYLACEDDPVRSCLLFIETIRDVPRFTEAAIACRRRGIRLIACKVGRSERSRDVSSTHTAAMAGPIELFDALFEKLGIWAVGSLDQLRLCAQLDWWDERVDGGLAAVSFSGGQAALMADAIEADGLELSDFSPTTVARLKDAVGAQTVHQPFDAGGQVVNDPHRWSAVLSAISDQSDVYGLAVGLSAVAGGDDARLTDELARLAAGGRNVALLWSSGTSPKSTVPTLAPRGVPVFERIEDATACLRIRHDRLSRPAASDEELAGYLHSLGHSGPAASPEALDVVLRDAGLQLPAEILCNDIPQVAAAFRLTGGPVVLKAANLLHKSDAGGVAVGLACEASLCGAAERMSAAHGFPLLVQQQVAGGREVILGFSRSELGTAVVLGAGGVLAELVRDSVTLLAPLAAEHVRGALRRLAIGRVLAGYRGFHPVAVDPIVNAAVALGRFALEHPGVASVDINPIIIADDGASFWAVDRKLVVGEPS